jgi:hypothetical protein
MELVNIPFTLTDAIFALVWLGNATFSETIEFRVVVFIIILQIVAMA